MNQPGPVPAPGAGERWSVNMPAVIGVVFVFLVAVIVWVIATGGDGDGNAAGDTTTTRPAATPAALVTTTLPGATTTVSPTPLPATTLATTIVSTTPPTSTTAPATTEPATTEPATTAPTTAPPTTTPPTAPPDDDDDDDGEGDAPTGDLGIAGTPMRSPACDDDFITVIASAVGAQATADSIAAVIDGFPGSNYLRTDQTCPSLNPSVGGEPIYVVYFGPFDDDGDACAARSQGSPGSYVRRLSNSLGPDHSVTCG